MVGTKHEELFPPNTKVTTTRPNETATEMYTEEGFANKRWGAKGEIVDHHDSHGLCYVVQHEDGTKAAYGPTELVLRLEPGDSFRYEHGYGVIVSDTEAIVLERGAPDRALLHHIVKTIPIPGKLFPAEYREMLWGESLACRAILVSLNL